ncbi:MAG: hypothetical protein SGPRY_004182 [Prymnesium sp.]
MPSRICPGGGLTRVACVGDSLTFGDGYHSYKLGTVRRCGWADAHCRGNWPMMLQKMLGERFDVRNFGKMGWPACRRLPLACLESSDATYTTPLSLTNSSTEQLNGCARAMRKWQVTQEALAFAPHILLLMLGTNDAMGSNWKQCGGDGFERAIALLLRVVLAEPISPFVLLLQCGSGECTSEKPSAAPHNASAQHEQVCSPLFTRYVNERASKAWLSGLENIALGPEVARVSEKNQKREKRVP